MDVVDGFSVEALDPKVFGHRLRHVRKQRGLTLDQLGEAIGRPAPFLSLVENGKREPKLSQISRLAEALAVPVAELLDPEPPTRRAALEIELERIQDHPRFEELGLPELKPSARLPDEALEHIVTLFRRLDGGSEASGPSPQELRQANGELAGWLRRRDGYLEEVEGTAREVLHAIGYRGPGPITSRGLADLADYFGYRIKPIEDVPGSVRSVIDRSHRRIYVAQRNELRTRQARKAVLQTLGSIALGHQPPRSAHELLRHRLETAYFAAAVLVPELSAAPFLETARDDRDLSVEDLKEQFYVSYEMAAQRFTNLATRHLGLECHFLRSDEDGRVWKAYANDGLPLPTDEHGSAEGQRLCRRWGARAAFASKDRFDIHYQFTDTPAGSYWCATHLAVDDSGHAFTVGVRFEDARVFRGRNTTRQLSSACPDGECCRIPPADLAERWEGQVEAHPRLQSQLLGLLTSDLGSPIHPVELYELAERHRHDPEESPSHPEDLE